MHTIETFEARNDAEAVRFILACARHDANRWATERRKEQEAAEVKQRLADAYVRQKEVEWQAHLYLACMLGLAAIVAIVAVVG